MEYVRAGGDERRQSAEEGAASGSLRKIPGGYASGESGSKRWVLSQVYFSLARDNAITRFGRFRDLAIGQKQFQRMSLYMAYRYTSLRCPILKIVTSRRSSSTR